MQLAQFVYDQHIMNYYRYGKGDKVMIAFHGFGLSGESFSPIAEVLKQEYTIYSFDLFFHGKSHWVTLDKELTPHYWKKLFSSFLNERGIQNFSLMGFSLGGKFVLTSINLFPQRIENILLLAPDGIQTQIWYDLATYPVVFQSYFRSMIVKPHRFYSVVNLVKRLGLLDKGLSKFAISQMNTIKKRRRVYYAWLIFKRLKPSLDEIAKKINHHNIPISFYLGTYDRIITKKGMSVLTRKIKNVKIHLLPCGHNNLIEHTADFLKQIS